jgi:hypothetical protein
LDRTFSLYRQNFLLFVALAGIPRLPSIALAFAQLWVVPSVATFSFTWLAVSFYFVAVVLGVIGYLLAQGGTTLAVSELYLGRETNVADSFRRVADQLLPLLGVVMLNGLAIGVGFVLLIIPGIYLMCRLLVCVPAAVIEKMGPSDSLARSYQLTQGFAGRAFVVLVFYVAVAGGLELMVSLPAVLGIAMNSTNPDAVRAWASVQTIVGSFAEIVLTPILLIATAIYYYDLRVRKEAFDLQLMMNPNAAHPGSVVPEGQ